jgi:hypothetical protein
MAKVFWNKLGSDAQILASEVGVNGTIPGSPTYAACKFDDGVELIHGGVWSSPIIEFTNAFNSAKGTFDFYFKSYFDSTFVGEIDLLQSYNGTTIAADGYFDVRFSSVGGVPKWCILMYSPPNSGSAPASCYYFDVDTAFSSGDKVHVGVSFDNSLGATEKIKVIVNGTQQSFFLENASDSWTDSDLDIVLGIGYGANHIIDDLVIWDDVKTDFSDRIYEGRVAPASGKQSRVIWF